MGKGKRPHGPRGKTLTEDAILSGAHQLRPLVDLMRNKGKRNVPTRVQSNASRRGKG